MRRAIGLAATVVLALCANSAQADPFAYAITPDPDQTQVTYRLIQVDLATGVSSNVGRIGYFDVEGLAIAPDGTLYGVSDANKTLITIDPSFGRGTAVGIGNGNLGLSGQGISNATPMDFGLTFSCDGRLWMSSDTTGRFWEVNRNTGEARFVGFVGANISGLAGAPDGVYGISVNAPQGLYKINLETGAGTRVGGLGNTSPFVDAGMDADSAGNLWAVLDYNPPPDSRPGDLGKQSDLVRVNAQTGLITYVSKTFPEVEGLAIGRPPACAAPNGPPPAISVVPVSSELSLALLALILLGIGMIRFYRSQS